MSSANHILELIDELNWLESCIDIRIKRSSSSLENDLPPPPVIAAGSAYASFVQSNNLSANERLVLALCLAPHLRPNMFNELADDVEIFRRVKLAKSQSGIALLPTAETALFIIAGEDIDLRLRAGVIFETEHLFYKQSVISIGETPKEEPVFNGIISLSSSFADLFIRNKYSRPRFSSDFPAHLLQTRLDWDDLLLMPSTKARLEEAKAYLRHYQTLVSEWGMQKHAKPGCRILFYGDSGTGKTLAATLLGKHLNRDVYSVDISAVSSKYVGETTKRLDSLFNIAESKGWIIFIDEGDALLGQRRATDAGGNGASHYANQDTAFLLQRIEQYDGIIIVATNFRGNIDQAFTRRFQYMVKFQAPDPQMQYQLWMENLPKKCPLAPGIDLMMLIQRHPLSPASIINVIFRLSVLALQKGAQQISLEDLSLCIKDEELKYAGRQAMGV